MRSSALSGAPRPSLRRTPTIVPPSIVPSAILLILAFLLAGCSADQSIMLRHDGSGEADVTIVLDPVFAEYLVDLTATLGAGEEELESVFDLTALRESFEIEPGLTLVEVHSPRPEVLNLIVEFDSLATLFAIRSSRLAGAFRFERTETFRRLAVRVDRRTVENLVNLAGIDPFVAESLLPPEGNMAPGEYRDYLVWALEEYERDRPVSEVINDSSVQTRVTPSGSITQVRGGLQVGSSVVFRTPLLEAVTTPVPLEYSVIFGP